MTSLSFFNKKLFLYLFFIFGLQQSYTSHAVGIEAVPYVGVAAEIYLLMKEIKSYSFPNEEEKLHAYQVAENMLC